MSPGARAELYFQIYTARGCTLPELATLLAEVGVEQASLATLRRYSSTYAGPSGGRRPRRKSGGAATRRP